MSAESAEASYAQSLWTSGDWEGAVAWFGQAQRGYQDGPLPSGVAWRFGALLYLRGDTEQAMSVLARTSPADPLSGDDALCLAWLASAQWSRGQIDDAEASAEQASTIARASGDAHALAAAHVALALVAAARGDREANDRQYRAGIAAARSVGDTVQTARIYANLASRALEEGRYAQAVEYADVALDLGAGHRFFTGLSLSNKAEALLRIGRLDDARACAAESVQAYAACGSLLECGPHLILGEVHRQRGEAVHARLAAERAARLGRKADDLQALIKAWAALAWILAIDDPVSARRLADQAVERATSLGRADALNAAAWVCLCAGQVAQAEKFAHEGEEEARRTDDRPNLAIALELRAVADPARRAALAEAIALWAQIGDPLALARARLSAGLLEGEPGAIEAARAELVRYGAAVDVGLPRLLKLVCARPGRRGGVADDHHARSFLPDRRWRTRADRRLAVAQSAGSAQATGGAARPAHHQGRGRRGVVAAGEARCASEPLVGCAVSSAPGTRPAAAARGRSLCLRRRPFGRAARGPGASRRSRLLRGAARGRS